MDGLLAELFDVAFGFSSSILHLNRTMLFSLILLITFVMTEFRFDSAEELLFSFLCTCSVVVRSESDLNVRRIMHMLAVNMIKIGSNFLEND